MTIPLEFTGDTGPVQRNFDTLASRAVAGADGGELVIAVGQDDVSFTASATSTAKTITHGLGRTPRAIEVLSHGGSPGSLYNFCAGNEDGTTFQVFAQTIDGSTPTTTRGFFWVAYG